MKIHRQRFPKHYVKCVGYLFSLKLTRFEDINERIMQAWVPGCSVYNQGEMYIFLLPDEIEVNAGEAIGQVLMKSGAYISNVILSRKEYEGAKQAVASLILLYQGEQLVIHLDQCKKIDPLQWINLSSYKLVLSKPLGLAPQPAAKNVEVLKEQDVRSLFKDEKYQVSDAQKELITALKEKDKRFKMGKSSMNTTGHTRSGLYGMIARLLSRSPQSGNSGNASSVTHKLSYKPNRLTLGQRISSMIMSSRLGGLIGRQQAKYVKKMMSMFEQGDIDDALRHAIPLSDMKEVLEKKAPSMFSPSIRNNLNIEANSQRSGYSYNIGESFHEHLRALYEKTFKRLDSQGKYADAAFVLAELLNDAERAIDYLDKHKQYQLAAELAEGRQVTPARVIRQWVIAGNIERAMFIANLTGCYSEAITLLERNHKQDSDKLRQLFANKMADAGNYERAVDIAWPVQELRDQCIQWLDLAIEDGGEIGARMIVRKIAHDPDELIRYKSRLKTIFENPDDKYFLERKSIIHEITKTREISPDQAINLRVIYRLSLKSYARDCSQGFVSYSKSTYNRLATLCDDVSLKTDLKPLSLSGIKHQQINKLLDSKNIWELNIKSAGRYVIHDAVLISRNRYLIALGEVGVHIINSDGKIQHVFKAPCHKIVISDQLNRAILVARRDMSLSLTRLDLSNNKITSWKELPAAAYSDTFDGLTWYISGRRELTGLDMQSPDVTPIWHVHDLPGEIEFILRDTSNLLMLLSIDDENYEMWRYQLPSMSLKERTPFKTELVNQYDYVALRMDGAMLGVNYSNTEYRSTLLTHIHGHIKDKETQVYIEGKIISVQLDMNWVNISCQLSDNEFCLYFIDYNPAAGPNKVRLIIKGENLLNARTYSNNSIVYDSTGRLMHIDLLKKEIISDIYS